jgi:Bacteriocin-protection, YdeI or OmpD-Associated/Domain of unknown function (DUF1905)
MRYPGLTAKLGIILGFLQLVGYGGMVTKEESSARLSFRATIILGGKTATGFEIPDEIVAALGSGKRPAVRVTINGYTYRSTVAIMGGANMLPLSAENRGKAGVAAGDEVAVEVALDTEPREVAVPPDLAAAIETDLVAKENFLGLSYSNKRGFVQQVEGAKTAETRQRRIDKAVTALRAGQIRM